MLFITTELFIPKNCGGSIATFNYFKKYHDENTILIAYFDKNKNKYKDKHLRYKFNREFKIKRLELIPFDIRIRKKPIELIRAVTVMLFKQYPYIAAKFYSKNLIAKVKNCVKTETISTVFIDHLSLAFLAPLIKEIKPDMKLIKISHNNESEIVGDFAKTQSFFLKRIAIQEKKLIQKFQKQHYAYFKKIKCISVVDAHHLNTNLDTDKFEYDPMPFVFNWPYQFRYISRDIVGTCGSLSWPPNIQSIEWYLEHIHPRLLKERKSYRFVIAGSGGGNNLREKWSSLKGVEYLGFVNELKDFYRQCKLVVVPLLSGSGIRIKILDAFSFGVPIVATLKAAQGLNISHNQEALISDNPKLFLKYINRLLDNPDLRRTQSERAYKFLKTNHN